MLPFVNPSLSDTLIWTRDALAQHLGLASTAAGKKKLERLCKEVSYFPPLIGLEDIVNADGKALLNNLMPHEVASVQSKRGKWLIVQYWCPNDQPAMICAHDGRGARYWCFSGENQNVADQLQAFIDSLAVEINQPILLYLHGPLAAYRCDCRASRRLKLATLSYPEHYQIAITNAIKPTSPTQPLSHLDQLEAESIHIIREVVAEAKNPVMLYSIGKDSAVMLHLARKAFWPGKPPFSLLHVDTGWKFRAMYEMRDQIADAYGMELLIHKNPDGIKQGINPIDHGSAIHTDIMKTQGLKQALNLHHFDAAFGGARRDEEKSRAKERIFSFRTATHQWDPKNQRPECWNLFNTRVAKGESIRVFPLSNWTELDIWTYIHREEIPIVPLYFSAERPVINRDGSLIMVDDERLPLANSDKVEMKAVRFRTLGCYPLTGAVESPANSVEDIILELLTARTSERSGRTIDKDAQSSMEEKKKEGYF